MFMTQENRKFPATTPPKQAVVKHRRNGTPTRYDFESGKLFEDNRYFTVFPSKADASRAMRRMCLEHEPEFWKIYDVYEYEEE